MSERQFLNRAVAFLCAGILSVSSFCVTNAFAENTEIFEETITENTKRTPRELLKLTTVKPLIIQDIRGKLWNSFFLNL